ncbi:MAG TPA: type II toxin-antitoxin system prevent-host-death family antitoxin [Candidatus Micrarchaeia archaeon]|nr:type II toxin-antitoxin system prevent-host-death family antitoxin [Candidatus Micrarchaeia archaeon]
MDVAISVRELRNHLSQVLRRVEAGERLTVTVARRPVATLAPLHRRATVPMAVALAVAHRAAADRGLLEELRAALPDTTDDV